MDPSKVDGKEGTPAQGPQIEPQMTQMRRY